MFDLGGVASSKTTCRISVKKSLPSGGNGEEVGPSDDHFDGENDDLLVGGDWKTIGNHRKTIGKWWFIGIYWWYISSGWWFGTWLDYFSIGNVIIPIDELLFFRGVQTTNQWWLTREICGFYITWLLIHLRTLAITVGLWGSRFWIRTKPC